MDTRAAQSKLTLLAVSLLFLPFLQANNISFNYCDKNANYVVKVDGLIISPYPVVGGKTATFNISASTGQAISGGTAVIDVFYFGMHVDHEPYDFCEETSCPIPVGEFLISHHPEFPAISPPGSYLVEMRLLSSDNSQELTCISYNFSLISESLVSDS
ncbi:hypothetical protein CCACVL1_08048 [Corchorus capsularis]|uniref:MD-2-related lipid-recognition domain-containing protein n=1 Tax=Corchorus capsularis TaxID=210143 RepID=A0A1R3J2I6_COCAP|nr:hypothetical protein CCACVL1_08048 [Corchorus capsularis]